MLINQSWTDEEYRSMEQMYLRRVVEAERVTSMLGEISAYIGPVGSPAMLLKGMAQAHTWFPSSFYYDREGCAGMVFVATVFEHREIAQRFEACRKTLSAIAEKHRGHNLGDRDPAFEIIRHLDNNWWGRRPTINRSWPNDFADALMEKYPAPLPDADDPKMLVHNGKVYVRTEFRVYTDEEAKTLGKSSAYLEDDDLRIVSGGSDAPHWQPFTIAGWIDQPDNVKGTDGKWYLVGFGPAVDAGDDDARKERLTNAYRTAMDNRRVSLTKNTTASGTLEDTRNLHGDGVVIGWLDGDVLQPDTFASDEDSFVDQMFRKGIDVA